MKIPRSNPDKSPDYSACDWALEVRQLFVSLSNFEFFDLNYVEIRFFRFGFFTNDMLVSYCTIDCKRIDFEI